MLKYDLYKPWAAGEKEWGFEIVDGEFSGTVIQVQEVNFKDGEEDGLQVEYHVINGSEEELSSNPLFVSTFELIINDILQEAVKDYEQNRNNDTKESSP